MGSERIFLEFVRWACVPILLFGFGICSHNVYKDMKYCLRKHHLPVFFFGNLFTWYVMLLLSIAWVILWVC